MNPLVYSFFCHHVLRIVDLSNKIGIRSFLFHHHPERVIQNQSFGFLYVHNSAFSHNNNSLILHLGTDFVNLELNLLDHNRNPIALELARLHCRPDKLVIIPSHVEVDDRHCEVVVLRHRLHFVLAHHRTDDLLRLPFAAPFDEVELFVGLFEFEPHCKLLVGFVFDDFDVLPLLVVRRFEAADLRLAWLEVKVLCDRERHQILHLFEEVRVADDVRRVEFVGQRREGLCGELLLHFRVDYIQSRLAVAALDVVALRIQVLGGEGAVVEVRDHLPGALAIETEIQWAVVNAVA
jgi:hypothetical protein